ncbi:sensor histidine kinase [Leeuwenhoekiella sp. H156]|uniref:sensor histidine kinase n=1 Tax=Leeuwenhoekiella sp. H156 TaxID=3450128 RepID=UPI003FA45A9B
MKSTLFIIVLFFSLNPLQSSEIKVFFAAIRESNYESARQNIQEYQNREVRKELLDLINILEKGIFLDTTTDIEEQTAEAKNLRLYKNGWLYYLRDGNEVKAFESFKNALEAAKKRNDAILICESLKAILEIYERFNQEIEDESYNYFINLLEKKAYDTTELHYAAYYRYRIIQRYYYKDTLKINQAHQDAKAVDFSSAPKFLRSKVLLTQAAYFQQINALSKATEYLNTSQQVLASLDGYLEKERFVAAKINKTVLDFKKGFTQRALEGLEKINIESEDYLYALLYKYTLFWKSELHRELGNTAESVKLENDYLLRELEGQQAKNLQIVSEYETIYQTKEKERQNQELQQEKRTLLIVLILSVSLISTIGFLVYKNSQKKRKLAEQQKDLERQKVSNLLKDQELASIDAMIEGQEIERARIAGELHDDLGALMTNVRMHFEALKNAPSEDLYQKTNTLLDEAYAKVRTIAHAKNSGVIANQGLLKALKDLAHKISQLNGLQIDVQAHGMDTRLENSLELSLFRIIQELITNVIKHAQAKTLTIHLVNHGDSLNIMVEDDGVGFDPRHISKRSEGMGINAIDKRVAHLNGTLEIESEPGQGTSVIIDLPL